MSFVRSFLFVLIDLMMAETSEFSANYDKDLAKNRSILRKKQLVRSVVKSSSSASILYSMDTPVTTNEASKKAQWMYEVPSDFGWYPFRDVESNMIEEAYQANERYVITDFNHVDLHRMVRIGDDGSDRELIKRNMFNISFSEFLRKAEKIGNVARHIEASARPGMFGDFIWEAYLLGQWRDVPQSVLVEKMVQGIIQEGKLQREPRTAEWMGKYLLAVKHATRKQIWYRCVYLYTLETFLYQHLNLTLSRRNFQWYEEDWKRCLQTLGLFAWFLFDFPQDVDEFEGCVYRGLFLDDADIDYFTVIAKTGELLAFPTFTSTSRSRSVAERWGNTLFIISIARSRETSVDVSSISSYPEEEEQLLIPGFLFKVTGVENVEKKDSRFEHIIYLQDCNKQ